MFKEGVKALFTLLKSTIMDFEKVQFRVSVNPDSDLSSVSLLNIEIGYPDSYGELNWKSNARIMQNVGFSKTVINGEVTEMMEQATWKRFDEEPKAYVFDFSKSNSDAAKIRVTFFDKKGAMNINEHDVNIDKPRVELDNLIVDILKINI